MPTQRPPYLCLKTRWLVGIMQVLPLQHLHQYRLVWELLAAIILHHLHRCLPTKHPTPNNETMMMQHQQVYHHRYFAMSRFFQTWILPHWKMKLVRFIFFLYPYLEGYHKGRHPYDVSVYSVTKILSQMFAYSLYPDLIFTFLSKCRAMESFLDKTPLSLYMESDLHAMHVSSGKWLFYATWIHVLSLK